MDLQVVALAVVFVVFADLSQTRASFFGGARVGRFPPFVPVGPFQPPARPVLPRPGGTGVNSAKVLQGVMADPAARAKYERLMQIAPLSVLPIPVPCPCTTSCSKTTDTVDTPTTIPTGATVCAVIFPPGGYSVTTCDDEHESCTEILGCGSSGSCSTGGTRDAFIVSACLLPLPQVFVETVTVTTNCCCEM